ncbi:MAG TPA: MFS transporter [Lactovum miscens]|uniref:MFS transporter n=1 Tax=Lactovum miscens TaxID=190387 RepID=UPI002ED87501
MNKFFLVLLSNRFISLISEYGYTILLNIIIAQISIQFVMLFWLIKALAALLSMKISSNIFITNKKAFLITLEILKGAFIAFIIIFKTSYVVLFIVFLIEIINVLFNSTVYSTVPKIIGENKLIKFNSLYTSVGSISYFAAPLLVGLLIDTNENLLFFIYSFLLVLGAVTLLLLPGDLNGNERDSKIKKEKVSFFGSFDIISKNNIVFNMFITSLITGTLGVVFDAYEVIFIIDSLGVSKQLYSFSLSFLAIVFLLVSFSVSFVKKITNFYKVYGFGFLLYLFYLIIFGNATNIFMILVSYIFLAAGQIILGVAETNYQQTHLNSQELNQIYTVSAVLNQFFGGMSVMLFGMIPLLSNNIRRTNMILSVIVVLISSVFFLSMISKKKEA